MNPYATLEVDRAATPEKIRRAYRKKAAKLHPDNLVTGDAAAFVELVKANRILADPQAKQLYDETGVIVGEDRLTDDAMNMLVQIVHRLVAQDPDSDLVIGLRQTLANMTRDAAAGIAKIEKSMAAVEKRWSGADSLKAVILLSFHRQIAAIEARKGVQRRAEEILASAIYAPGEPPPISRYGARFDSLFSGNATW